MLWRQERQQKKPILNQRLVSQQYLGDSNSTKAKFTRRRTCDSSLWVWRRLVYKAISQQLRDEIQDPSSNKQSQDIDGQQITGSDSDTIKEGQRV